MQSGVFVSSRLSLATRVTRHRSPVIARPWTGGLYVHVSVQSRDTLVPRMCACLVARVATSHSNGMLRGPHILGSQSSLRVAYWLIGARMMSWEHIRKIAGSVEALVVCTPNCHHMDALRRTIPTGNHMLCEWPFCTMGGQWSIGRSLTLSILEHRTRFLVKVLN